MVQPGIIKNAMAKLSRLVPFKRKNINNGSGVINLNSNEDEMITEVVDYIAALELQVKAMEALAKLLAPRRVAAGYDGSGGGGDGSGGDGGGGGGDCDGDNDGGDKTEGGGGGGGKMGTKMEPKGQHDDNRNRFSYHGGDENGYPVGQLHRCYYQKPNVCSIIPYQVLV